MIFLLCSLLCIKTIIPAPAAALPHQDKIYPIAVSFGSMCCGPSSDQFLKDFVKKFNKKNGAKITGEKYAGCGREGEFVIVFSLNKTKKNSCNQFMKELEKLLPQQEAKTKKAKSSSGGFQKLTDVKASDYSHCRLGKTKWI